MYFIQDNSGIQVFNPRGLFVSRVWRSQFPWQCYGLAEDKEGHLWFIDSNRKTGETHLKCYDPKKGGLVKGISLKQLVGDRFEASMCRFLTYFNGKLFITDLGLDQAWVYILPKAEGGK